MNPLPTAAPMPAPAPATPSMPGTVKALVAGFGIAFALSAYTQFQRFTVTDDTLMSIGRAAFKVGAKRNNPLATDAEIEEAANENRALIIEEMRKPIEKGKTGGFIALGVLALVIGGWLLRVRGTYVLSMILTILGLIGGFVKSSEAREVAALVDHPMLQWELYSYYAIIGVCIMMFLAMLPGNSREWIRSK